MVAILWEMEVVAWTLESGGGAKEEERRGG